MANTVSSLKRVRITERRTAINQVRRSRLRNQIRAMRRLLDKKETSAAESMIPATFSLIDRATKWGIVKKNTAARYKSRVHLRMKKLSTAAA